MKKSLLSYSVPSRMALFIRGILLPLLLVMAATVYGGIPSMKVIVSDENGNVAFKGTTKADATFATAKLSPGNYVVQFKSLASEENHYLLVVSAGNRKVTANDVPGEKFGGAGVAMRVKVANHVPITGQVASTRLIDGKRYFWQVSETGSNLGGRWIEARHVDPRQVVRLQPGFLRRMQDYSGEGSMLNRYQGNNPGYVHEGY